MDRVKAASILEEIVLQFGDLETMINDAALILLDFEDEDERAEEWCDRFINHGLRRQQGEFGLTVQKLVTALNEGGDE